MYDSGERICSLTENKILDNVILGIGGDGDLLLENGSRGCEVEQSHILRKKKQMLLWAARSVRSQQIIKEKGCMLDGIYVENIGNAVMKI